MLLYAAPRSGGSFHRAYQAIAAVNIAVAFMPLLVPTPHQNHQKGELAEGNIDDESVGGGGHDESSDDSGSGDGSARAESAYASQKAADDAGGADGSCPSKADRAALILANDALLRDYRRPRSLAVW